MHYTDIAQDFLGVDETNLPQHGTRAQRSASNGKTWAIVLAGGSGTRLRPLTMNRAGIPVPKQYCSLDSGPSLLRAALQRAFTVVPRLRTSVVVAEQHAEWWSSLARELPVVSIAVQPEDRGTATGILLALLRILERDPNARVVVLPSDHHVVDESAVTRSLANAIGALLYRRADIVLLGVTPDSLDTDLGYIAPAGPPTNGLFSVAEFVEKPARTHAAKLIAAGAIWNTFMLVANGRELLELMRAREADRRRRSVGHRGRGGEALRLEAQTLADAIHRAEIRPAAGGHSHGGKRGRVALHDVAREVEHRQAAVDFAQCRCRAALERARASARATRGRWRRA